MNEDKMIQARELAAKLLDSPWPGYRATKEGVKILAEAFLALDAELSALKEQFNDLDKRYVISQDGGHDLLVKERKAFVDQSLKETLEIACDLKERYRWRSVGEELPEANVAVLVFAKGAGEYQVVLRAYYAPKFTVEDDNQYEAAEYCEEKDEYFLCEGWYEYNEFDEVNWMVCESVTHWQPLPELPE